MKMGLGGGIGVMVVMAMMVVMGAQVEPAQAVSCLTVPGATAPFADAAAVVQRLRVRPGPCCRTGSGFCNRVARVGNAAASVCGSWSPCPSCAAVGNNLNKVLSQCNRNNGVQGAYSPDGSSQRLLYLTSNSGRP